MADRKNSDALAIIDRRHFSTPEARAQRDPPAISRLENDDYEGHSLAMLRRVAAALGRRVEVRFGELRSGTDDEPFGR